MREIRATLRGKAYRFITDAGVFSRNRVDPGTRLLIEAMEIGEQDRVLDMGCGYGPVGIVASNLASCGKVYLVDINHRAVELARENLRLNAAGNAEVLQGDGFQAVSGLEFDRILLNPPIRAGKAIVHGLIEGASDHISRGGRLYVVARTSQGAMTIQRKMAEVFGNADVVDRGGGYRVMEAIKH